MVSRRRQAFWAALIVVTALASASCSQRQAANIGALSPAKFVAHAGGAVHGMTYTNSREALDFNYERGFRFFEIDFNHTSDGALVLIHDWYKTYIKYFGGRGEAPSLQEFKQLSMQAGLHQMTAKELYTWLEQHHDAYVVTDVKNGNLVALKEIIADFPDAASRIVPQIYDASQFDSVRGLGYQYIIFTLYRTRISIDDLLKFVGGHTLFAVTMSRARVNEGDLATRLEGMGVFVYVHTVNDEREVRELKAAGVQGFYTDSLSPE